jgi:hypothetical protein
MKKKNIYTHVLFPEKSYLWEISKLALFPNQNNTCQAFLNIKDL